MTIWLDKITFEENLERVGISTDDITVEELDNNRMKITATANGNIELSEIELNNIGRFLSSIRTGDPNLKISENNGHLLVSIEANENVFHSNE